jgi:nuclear pore complex protein Nup210
LHVSLFYSKYFSCTVTGNILRADVFVNRINRIEITTTTRELLLGQSPELLDVIAFDDTGNLFSSLDGLVFDWELITVEGSIQASSVLR